MAHQHAAVFSRSSKIQESASETNIDEVKARLDRRETSVLIDVREESENASDHLPGGHSPGKGIIERRD